MNLRLPALLFALVFAAGAAHTQETRQETPLVRSVSPKSAARLIDGGIIGGDRYAGLEIKLAGAAITYWRDPGDAGVPPRFDFASSENVAAAEPLYPQPERIDEDGAQAFGYRHEVVFPIRVTPREKDKPAVLALSVDYAVCEKLCLPAHADLHLVLPPQTDAQDQLDRAQFAEAMKKVPRRLDASQTGAFARISGKDAAGGKPQWLLRLPQDAARDIFIVAPQGFFVDTASAGEAGAFLLTLVEHPAGTQAPDAPVRVTVAGPAPVEFDLTLPQTRL